MDAAAASRNESQKKARAGAPTAARDRAPAAALSKASLLSPQAAYLVVRILQDKPRPNESFVGQSAAKKAFFWKAQPGTWVLRATDEHGRSSACRFTVVQRE